MERIIAVAVTLLIAAAVFYAATFGLPEWTGTPPAPGTPTARLTGAPPGQPLAEIRLPSFDIVRVDPAGSAVIAGRALPDAEVTVLANGKELGKVRADARGDWVLYVDTPLDQGTQELTLVMRDATGAETTGEQTVVVAVPDRPGAPPLVVLSDDRGASRVLQSPEAGDDLPVSLEAIDYDETGAIVFAGRAAPGARVIVYVDNVAVGETTANADGVWRLKPQALVEPGVHDLRIDLLDADGKVVARVAVPFERERPEAVMQAEGTIVVQPGNSLWRISRRIYGTGFRYTLIYEANKDQIRDPDLIYPGQIFTLPADPGS